MILRSWPWSCFGLPASNRLSESSPRFSERAGEVGSTQHPDSPFTFGALSTTAGLEAVASQYQDHLPLPLPFPFPLPLPFCEGSLGSAAHATGLHVVDKHLKHWWTAFRLTGQ